MSKFDVGDVRTMTIWPGDPSLSDTLSNRRQECRDRFQIGDCLNDCYEIRGILGSGGMGQVFEAYDRQLKRMVALKVPWTDQGFAALESEAIALAALSGHGVPEVYGIFETATGVRYYVMERLRGETLAGYLGARVWNGPLPIGEAINILVGIADALSELHEIGLIHCDLKPANIMLAPRNRIVLLDLGLFLSKGETGNAPEAYMLRGSPHYVAPERITSTVNVNSVHQLDIYSLGIIGFLLLTGLHPFDGDNLRLLLRQHLHQPAPPISILRRGVPWQVERIIAEMLSKDPTQRPSTASAVSMELKTLRSEQTRLLQ